MATPEEMLSSRSVLHTEGGGPRSSPHMALEAVGLVSTLLDFRDCSAGRNAEERIPSLSRHDVALLAGLDTPCHLFVDGDGVRRIFSSEGADDLAVLYMADSSGDPLLLWVGIEIWIGFENRLVNVLPVSLVLFVEISLERFFQRPLAAKYLFELALASIRDQLAT